ncbi:MAG: ATP-binding cassette domain-containing protein, partial [bacterium]
MVGRKVVLRVDKAPRPPGETVLEVRDLRVRDRAGHERVRGVSFAVRRGEIVGIAGVAGNGQSELLDALAGSAPLAGGRIVFKGRDITDSPARTAEGLRALGLG